MSLHHQEYAPGNGRRSPRASLTSDAPTLSLNGDWCFRYFPTVAAARASTADLTHPDLADPGWDLLPVPGHWQLHGYGAPAYNCCTFPFPVEPPYVPDENPTGHYRRVFELPRSWAGPESGSRVVLRFEGVDSSFTVWLNGHELGWSTGSRLPTEFDLTDRLVAGRNVLGVRVHQWSAGSYLEDQDMWWLSGIFRDVTLLLRPAGGIEDLFVRADYDHRTGQGTLRVETDQPTALLTVPELGLVDVPAAGPHHLELVEPWSAEEPRCYRGMVRTGTERVELLIGFRTVVVEDGLFKVNGRRIVFRGVNRHEWHPDRGRALTEADMLADLLILKQHNVNAVRTSHYPPHPRFLELCDELGMWVIDECDLETHGFCEFDWHDNPSADPRWRGAFLDRMTRMVHRDRNHPSIVIWSLANESNWGDNLEAMAVWTRDADPSRPILYEHDQDSRYVDLYSRMYLTVAEVDAIGRRVETTRGDPAPDTHRRGLPFILVEYAHAMGNGPGNLAEYQELFETYPRCQGGFVWEYLDHGLRKRTADGREFFAYGGDFDEETHDGNFVVDGLFFSDRTPTPGALEYKKTIEPVRIEVDDSGIRVTSRYDLIDTSHLRFRWVLEQEGVKLADGALTVPPVAPGQTRVVPCPALPTRADASAKAGGLEVAAAERMLTICAQLATDQPWAAAGHEVAWSQVPISTRPPAPGGRTAQITTNTNTTTNNHTNTTYRLGSAEFDLVTGQLIRVGDVLVDNLRLDLWRAPTDNDRPLQESWRAYGLHRLRHRVVDVASTDAGETLLVRARVAPGGRDIGFDATYRWSADQDGVVLDLQVRPQGEWPFPLPRFGVHLTVPTALDQADWYGRGPGESYPDSRSAARVGNYAMPVAQMQTPYAFPQENGCRSDVRWATLTDASGRGLRFEGRPAFCFTARPWSNADLDAARHPTDLVPGDRIHLNLDLAHNGLGTGSCGPGVLPQYELRPQPTSFRIAVRPWGN